ncbi:MAG: glycosyltransferase family 2 protein [Spartobacteria bacterium]|nr:glycosyltransferase family 2 protein [Spartobacteria bacterium]
MGDADDSYDFTEIPNFVAKLREGYDLVQGCRLPKGGGVVAKGAMPWTHRFIGNPLFSFIARWWFHVPITDIYCGMRGFSKAFYTKLEQHCTGMEFATEMIIKSSLKGGRIAEIPITLHQDGRVCHPPHLNTMRDGRRTLRYFLMLSPTWLYMVPGIALVVLGLLGYVLSVTGAQFGQLAFKSHTLLFSSISILCGYQAVLFAIFSKTFAVNNRFLPESKWLTQFFSMVSLERGIATGLLTFLIGMGLMGYVFFHWSAANYDALEYAVTMPWAITGTTLTALGIQTILSGFFVSILGMKKK